LFTLKAFMFVTRPGFERTFPPKLIDPGSRYWLAAELSTGAPWYLMTYWVLPDTRDAHLQTVAIAWETTLIGLVEEVGPLLVVAINRLELKSKSSGGWSIENVQELWLPAKDELKDVGPLIFKTAENASLTGMLSGQVERDHLGRRCLIRFPAAQE
jgi:hypothetical protein